MSKKLTESKEMYLKAVYHLSQIEGSAKSIDIAAFLGVSKPSVTAAMRELQQEGFVSKDLYKRISLTPKGREIAIDVIKKYNVLLSFFSDILGLNLPLAKMEAGKIEHIVSEETILKIQELPMKDG